MNFFERPAAPIVLLCVGLGLLFTVGIFSRSIWFDEAITIQSLAAVSFRGIEAGPYLISELKPYVSGNGTLAQLLEHYVSTDVHPPLYFLVTHGFTLIFGNSLVVARMVSLLLVLGSVAAYARALHRNELTDSWAYVAIYGLSFAAMSTAQDARGYSMILLLAVLAWRVLSDLPEHHGRARLAREIWLGLICGGLLYTHYFSVLLVVALFAWHLCDALARRTPAALIAPLVCTLVFLPWLPILFDHMTTRPGAFAGFQGLGEWVKRAALLTSGQVLSASHYAFPDELQKWGRLGVLGLMVVGAAMVLWRPGDTPRQRQFSRIAVFVPTAGLPLFLVVSVVMDRWFDTFRYFLFYAPFVAFLAARGAFAIGSLFARFGPSALRLLPASLLIAAQFAMLNFGWESNRNRGGAYYNSVAQLVEATGVQNTLVLIDMGTGRGTPLAATYGLPDATQAYLLPWDDSIWAVVAEEITPQLEDMAQVLLLFTIERGDMASDKALLYAPIVAALERDGFTRVAASPSDQGPRYYARWVKSNAQE